MQEKATLVGKVQRTEMRMPFDGNILTLHLNERVNSVLDRASLCDRREHALGHAPRSRCRNPRSARSSSARDPAKPNAFFDREFLGKVQTIDRNVTAKPFGNVVKVIAVIDNPNGELKTGMTGYAKIGPARCRCGRRSRSRFCAS